MIRINLLPFRAARKRENIRRQVSISGLMSILFIVLLVVWSISLLGTASGLKDDENSKTAELQSYQKELDDIKNLEKMIKEIKAKLDVIKELEKGKTGPVLLLSTISDAVPKEKLWLTSLTESNGTLRLTGTAMDNETVALFNKNLEAAKDIITSVELKSSVSKEIQKQKVKDFVFECKTSSFKAEKKATPKKAGKK